MEGWRFVKDAPLMQWHYFGNSHHYTFGSFIVQGRGTHFGLEFRLYVDIDSIVSS